MQKHLSYYVTGHTADGFVNYVTTNVENLNVIQLNHPSYSVTTKVLEQLISHYEADYDIEIICSDMSEMYIDGIIIRDLSFAVITQSIIMDELEVTAYIHLEDIVGKAIDFSNQHEKIDQQFKHAYDYFAKGLKIHDDLEKIYINEMDFSQADDLAEKFIDQLLHDIDQKNHQPHIYRRLFGTNTIEGSVNNVPHLIQTVNKRYYVKGRAGTGKSVFMNKVADACLEKGFDIELYHCSFDPSSIDMVLVRQLDFCIFDSTDPHEFSPESDHDEVIDLYEETVTPGTDEKFAKDIKRVSQSYKSYMKKGVSKIKEAGRIVKDIERKYLASIAEQDIKKVVKHILNKTA